MKGFGSFCQRSATPLVDANSTDCKYIRFNSHNVLPKKVYAIEEGLEYIQVSEVTKPMVEKLLSNEEGFVGEDHPFCDNKHHVRASLISFRD